MITIVGLGALGSHVATLLRNEEDLMKLVDFDKVEMKNTKAQFHCSMGIRKNKAFAMQQALRGMYGCKTLAFASKLRFDNSEELLKDSRLVLDCTDNILARETIQHHVKEKGIPCLHGCLSADGTFARIIWTDDFKPDAEGEVGEATCIDGEHLPFFALAASVMAIEAQRFLNTGKKCNFHVGPYGVIRL